MKKLLEVNVRFEELYRMLIASIKSKLWDLGGGQGLGGIAIVAAHPNMLGAIFDRLPIAKMPKTFIKEYEKEDRMEILEGDVKYEY